MSGSYYKCIAFDIRKFYGKWKYLKWYITFLVITIIVSIVPVYGNGHWKFPSPTKLGNSILMKYFKIELNTSIYIMLFSIAVLIFIIYLNSAIRTDFDGLSKKVLIGYVTFGEDYLEIEQKDKSANLIVYYKDILSYNKGYYGEISHYYWIELKSEIFYLKFYNQNYAAEIKEIINNKLQT